MQTAPQKSGLHPRVASRQRAVKARLGKAPRKSRVPPIIAIKKLAAKLSDRRAPNLVGEFFEHLMVSISTHVERNTTGEGADLYAPNFDASIEVKGGDNTHSHRIDAEQLDRHHEDTEEFLSANTLLYCFFRYRNRQPNGKTGLMRNKTDSAFMAYLFERVQDLWIIDHQVLVALAQKRPARTGALALEQEKKRRCLFVSKSDLNRLCGGDLSEAMTEIGLEPEGWVQMHRVLQLKATVNGMILKTELRIHILTPLEIDAMNLIRPRKSITVRLPIDEQAEIAA